MHQRILEKGITGDLRANVLKAAIVVMILATRVAGEEGGEFKTERERVNYAIGVSMVNNFKQQGIEVDLDLVMKGMKDAYSGRKLLLTDDELRKSIGVYQAAARQKQGTRARMLAAENNRKAGEAFLAENGKKEGVVKLESGLQYKVIKAGNGKAPAKTDTVVYNFRGARINGSEFDSSYRSGKPVTARIMEEGVIPGLREALMLMKAGSKWQLFIPQQLAYGYQGKGNQIEPNEALVFEVELLEIK